MSDDSNEEVTQWQDEKPELAPAVKIFLKQSSPYVVIYSKLTPPANKIEVHSSASTVDISSNSHPRGAATVNKNVNSRTFIFIGPLLMSLGWELEAEKETLPAATGDAKRS